MNEKLRLAQILIEIADTDFDVMDAEVWLATEEKLGSRLAGVAEFKYISDKLEDYGECIYNPKALTIQYLHMEFQRTKGRA